MNNLSCRGGDEDIDHNNGAPSLRENICLLFYTRLELGMANCGSLCGHNTFRPSIKTICLVGVMMKTLITMMVI